MLMENEEQVPGWRWALSPFTSRSNVASAKRRDKRETPACNRGPVLRFNETRRLGSAGLFRCTSLLIGGSFSRSPGRGRERSGPPSGWRPGPSPPAQATVGPCDGALAGVRFLLASLRQGLSPSVLLGTERQGIVSGRGFGPRLACGSSGRSCWTLDRVAALRGTPLVLVLRRNGLRRGRAPNRISSDVLCKLLQVDRKVLDRVAHRTGRRSLDQVPLQLPLRLLS